MTMPKFIIGVYFYHDTDDHSKINKEIERRLRILANEIEEDFEEFEGIDQFYITVEEP